MWGLGLAGAAVVLQGVDSAWGADHVAVFFAGVMAANALVPTPGAVGAYEAAGVAALGALGAAPGPALAASVLLHATNLGAQAMWGLYFLAVEGMPRRGPEHMAKPGGDD